MEYDEEFINGINEDFCQGFGTAKEILAGLFQEQYWKEVSEAEERQIPKPPERYLSPGVCVCPGCHRTLEAHTSKIFCCYCGQMLTYENEEDESMKCGYKQTLSSSVLAKRLADRLPKDEILELALYRELSQLPGGSVLRHVLEEIVKQD